MDLSPADTTLFYFLSTVAQAFAGAFGILGAFAALRVQLIRQAARDQLGVVREAVGGLKRIRSLHPCTDEIERNMVERLDGLFSDILGAADRREMEYLHRKVGELLGSPIKSYGGKLPNEPYTRLSDAESILICRRADEERLRTGLWSALALTCATLGCSLVLLCFTRWIAARSWIEYGAEACICVLCGLTLYSFYRFVMDSLAEG